MKTIYMVVGVPGSGKTWVLDRLSQDFHVIRHDDYISKKDPRAYVTEIFKQSRDSNKPIVIEAPFSMSQTIEPLERAGLKVILVFIIEDEATLKKRYFEREKKPIYQGHLTRTKTYLSRAKEGRYYYGTSQDVLDHLKSIKID